jgi:hypothetical protein
MNHHRHDTPQTRAARRAERVYAVLLRLYPRGHRRAYGPLMAQTFRDEVREALATSGPWASGSGWRRWPTSSAACGANDGQHVREGYR